MENALINLSNELAGIVRAADPHIVSIRGRRHYPSSGVLWGSGVVVTADHTVQREDDVTVTLATGKPRAPHSRAAVRGPIWPF